MALAIKLAKALTRECCTASTCGMGNWLQSLLEDVFSFVLIVLALAVLMASIVIGLGFLLVAFWFVVKRCKKCCEEKGGDSGEETPLVQGESAKEPLMPGEEDQEAAKKGWWEDGKKPKEGEGGNWWEDPNAPKGDGDGGAKPVNTV
uniref:DUF4126 domain-containing protein n=1 Tax=Fibrocapsa japonica TaxID=94617 RepID=A0A7S2XWL0_9STRA